MFDLAQICPYREYFPSLARLGKERWIRHEYNERDGGWNLAVDIPTLGVLSPEEGSALLGYIFSTEARHSGSAVNQRLLPFYHVSRVLACGPKVIRPGVATCRALSQMGIDMPLEDYAQPYDTMIVALPPAWIAEVREEVGGGDDFAYAIVTHDRPNDWLSTLLITGRGLRRGEPIMHFAIDSRVAPMIGEALSDRRIDARAAFDGKDAEAISLFKLSSRVERMVFNLGLLATYAGVKGVGWADPKGHAKREKLARLRGRRGEALLAGDVENFAFAQDVELLLGIKVDPRAAHQGGANAASRPHWRRRHWYMQAHGPGFSRRRLRLREGSFVRAKALPDGTSPSDVQPDYKSDLPEGT